MLRTRAIPTNKRDADDLFDQLVNGQLLAVLHPHVYSEELAVTISTIAALMKEFSLDWTAQNLPSKPLEEKQAALRELGFYCQLPVKQLVTLLRKRICCGVKHPSFSMASLINGIMMAFQPSEMQLLLLVSYLYTAIKAVKMSHPHFSIPFDIEITSRGKAFLTYSYRSRQSMKRRVRRYPLNCRFMPGVGASNPAMQELFQNKESSL